MSKNIVQVTIMMEMNNTEYGVIRDIEKRIMQKNKPKLWHVLDDLDLVDKDVKVTHVEAIIP